MNTMFTAAGDRGSNVALWTLVILVLIVGLFLIGYFHNQMEKAQPPPNYVFHLECGSSDMDANQLYSRLVDHYKGTNVQIHMSVYANQTSRFYYCGSQFRTVSPGYPDFDTRKGWTLTTVGDYIDHYVNLKKH